MIYKLKPVFKRMGNGFKQEYEETKNIPKDIKNKEYKKVAEQVGDIGKITFLSALWVLPGNGLVLLGKRSRGVWIQLYI